MIKERIKFTDFNGVEKEQDFYFNLTKAEIVEMEVNSYGLEAQIKEIISTKDQPTILKVFKEIIKKSYGIKTPEGGFRKNKESLETFMASEAYSVLFMKLSTDDKAAANFINGIIPQDANPNKQQLNKVVNGK